MLLTIPTTHRPATDLGFLLHKNPARPQSFDLSFGRAHVVYPEAGDDRCTAALILDIDPVGLVRGRRGPAGEGGLPLVARLEHRAAMVSRYTEAWRRYCWPVTSVADLKLAPFHVLAAEGALHTTKDHRWHLDQIGSLCAAGESRVLFSISADHLRS